MGWTDLTQEEKIEQWKAEGHVEVLVCRAPLVMFADGKHTAHIGLSSDGKKKWLCLGTEGVEGDRS